MRPEKTEHLTDSNSGAALTQSGRTRLFLPPSAFALQVQGLVSSQDAAVIHQLKNVLRLKNGDGVNLLDGLGSLWSARIASLARNAVSFELLALSASRSKAGQRIEIISMLPLIKAHRFEWALEKLTEIGVSKIIPFATSRTVVKIKTDEEVRLKRWQLIVKEAAEQSENLFMPEIGSALTLAQALQNLSLNQSGNEPDEKRLLLSERSVAPDMVQHFSTVKKSTDIPDASSRASSSPLKIILLVGPEGGFSTEELALISESNFKPASMGDTILRSETAAILSAGMALAIGSSLD